MKIAITTYNGVEVTVEASKLTERDRNRPFKCPECGAPAFLNISRNDNRENWFASNYHKEKCYMAEGGRTFRTPDGHIFHFDDLMRRRDKPLEMIPLDTPKEIKGTDGEKSGEDEVMPVDNYTIEGPEHHHVCKTMYKAMRNMRVDEKVHEDYSVGDVLIDDRTIEKARDEGLTGLKMMILRRFAPSTLDPRIPRKDGYAILRDAFTKHDDKAIYVYVRFEEQTHDEKFKLDLFGDPERGIERNPAKYIVAFGRVTAIRNTNYKLYIMSPLSTDRVCFLKEL